jgi:hypothetical protein
MHPCSIPYYNRISLPACGYTAGTLVNKTQTFQNKFLGIKIKFPEVIPI